MTPAEQCRQETGLTLAQIERVSGVSRQTLSNWHKNKPKLFLVVLKGSVQVKRLTLD